MSTQTTAQINDAGRSVNVPPMIRQPKRVVRPAGLAPRLVGAPPEPETPAQAPPAAVAVMDPEPGAPPTGTLKLPRLFQLIREARKYEQVFIHNGRFLIPVEELYCLRHAQKRPCTRCGSGWAALPITTPTTATQNFERLFERPVPDAPPPAPTISQEDQEKLRQQHQEIEQFNSTYDPQKYRHEINTALKNTRLSFIKERLPGQSSRAPDGVENLDDLVLIIDFEVWKTTKKHGDKMNGAIAYTIAKNQIADWVERRKKDEKFLPFITQDDAENDDTLIPNEPSTEAKPQEQDISEDFEVRVLPELRKLVDTWKGTKRKVANVLLDNPDTTVREIEEMTGVPKSTANRLREEILVRFRALTKQLSPWLQ